MQETPSDKRITSLNLEKDSSKFGNLAKLLDEEAPLRSKAVRVHNQLLTKKTATNEFAHLYRWITSIIKNSYCGMTCRVICGRQLKDAFQVNTAMRQGRLSSPVVFLLAIEWVLKTSTAQRGNGIQWTPWTQLDDLDIADDLALLSHTQ